MHVVRRRKTEVDGQYKNVMLPFNIDMESVVGLLLFVDYVETRAQWAGGGGGDKNSKIKMMVVLVVPYRN